MRPAAVCLASLLFLGNVGAPENHKPATIVVRGPTVIAFFEPIAEGKADDNEALYDFTYYVSRVREPLKKKGIEFHELSARSFKVSVGRTTTTFRSGKSGCGYYLIAPGKKPRIEDGVMTDQDLLDLASAYFK